MSTQRYIDTSFWDDAWVTELDPSEKLLYIYLLTNPLTNIAGVYKITTKRICFDTGFNSDAVGHILNKFKQAKKVYTSGEYIIIKNWSKNQKWETSPKIKDGIIKVLSDLPEETLKFLCEIEYTFDMKAVFDTLSIGYPYSPNYLNLNLNKDLNKDLNLNYNPNKKSELVQVKDFWYETYKNTLGNYPDSNLSGDLKTSYWKSVNKQLNTALKKHGLELCLKAIDYSSRESWILQRQFPPSLIFCETNIQNVITNKPHVGNVQGSAMSQKESVWQVSQEQLDMIGGGNG